MKTMRAHILLCTFAAMALAVMTGATGEFSPPSRTFLFTYQVTLQDLPAGAQRVRVWIPRASTDANQTVVLKQISGPIRFRETREEPYGNHILYGEIAHPPPGPAKLTVEYQVTRREYSRGGYPSLLQAQQVSAPAPKDLARFLAPDRLVPIDGRIKQLADEITRGKQGTVARAYALYDYVFQTVRYDKSGTGWGRGDSLWVCDAKHGNCTDFHSLFISLARAAGIPARFEIGFPVPEGTEGSVPGYHCWAEFYVNGLGWVPVDISEAWKAPKKHDYFFGTLDANRVQFSVGRDLALQPKQDGDPLNYFIYPYGEVDGKPFEGIEKKFTYREETDPHMAMDGVGGR
ncbi:MAG TPA: transglutaminase domain-containing protein [Terriglobia bacterium]|nr:transglutaminase domain-containing protein [Terriglobia bacterium]